MHSKTEWGGCYSGLSKKRSFLRQFPHKISRKLALFPTRKHSFLLLLPIVSTLGILALVSTFFISSDIASNSYALDGINLNSEITAEINGTHYITLSAPDVAFSITPDTNDSGNTIGLDTTKVDVSVETNAVGGAELYLSTSNNTNALYKDGNVNNSSLPSIKASLSTTSNPTTLDNLATNTWGYSLDNTNYSGVPTIESPNHIASIDGVNTGSTSSGIISATIPVYYAAKVDTSIPSGSYANSVTYSAVVDGGIVTSAELTSITINNSSNQPEVVEQLQLDTVNTILVTTNLKTNTYGIPRVYYTTTDPAGYSECNNVLVSSNTDGLMTIQCETTPTAVATGLTLHIVPKGTPSSTNPSDMTGDPFCSDGAYEANTSQCEAGEWKWGSFTVGLPDIALPPIPLMEQTYMQDMTPGGCEISNEGDTKQLIDKRDGKTYWVAKLADGNCWMTQNLELDLTAGESLTPELSDVSADWNPGATTFTSAQEGVRGSSYYNTVQSWNLGKYVWKTPNSASSCMSDTNLSDSSCASYWQDASNMTPMTTYRTDGVSVEGNTYDAHYLAGNYYSWEAATAGTGHSYTSSGAEASGSICPKGFELPLSHTNNNNVSGSFYNLLNQYGFTSSTGSGTNSITRAPLFFVRSGYVNPTYYLNRAGSYGYYWSSVANSSSLAYNLYFDPSYVNPSVSYNRYFGQSVRCVAPSA